MRAGLICDMSCTIAVCAEVPFAKHDYLVEHLSPDQANQPFSIGVLPWRSRCRWSVANAHRAKPPDVCFAVGTIAITHDIARRSLPVVSLRELSSNPFSR